MKGFCKLSALALLGVALTAQASQAQVSSGNDVMSKALTVHKFNTFLSLARDADLLMQLTDNGPFTIYMPTDEAFKAIPADKIEKLRWNKSSLRRFVLHHVVRGRYEAVQTVKMPSIMPMDGGAIKTEIIEGRGHVGGAKFVIPNVNASNGIIHGIDKVLWPNPQPAP